MKRVLCVWLPGWPVQRLRRVQPELSRRPLVLYALAARGKMLATACSPCALRRGIVPGMPLAEAKALGAPAHGPAVHFAVHDRRADHEALCELAVWCQRFSPWIAVEEAEEPESLLVDITGCGHLFGGEEGLAEKAVADLRRQGYGTAVAIADTFGAAWAVAHAGGGIVPPGGQAAALRPLRVEVLRLSSAALQLLHEFDIQRVEQLLALPRADLAARFPREVVQRLDQALGDVPEVLIPQLGVEPVEASWLFETPVAERRIIEAVLEHLLEQVLERLQPQQKGVQKLLCSLAMLDGPPIQVLVGLLQASACKQHLLELVRLHFERVCVPGEVSAITMHVAGAVPLEFRQGQLFAEDADVERYRQLPALIERLSNRLGEEAVLRPRLWPDAQPELACRYEPWLRAARHGKNGDRHRPRSGTSLFLEGRPEPVPIFSVRGPRFRPPCLTARPSALAAMTLTPGGLPLRFPWQGDNHVVAHAWGPERIETGWWRSQDVRRDYYLVETTTGKRFWLFRLPADGSWFLHGSFA